MLLTASLLTVALGVQAISAAGQSAEPPGMVVLVCEYEDGRTTYHTVVDGKGFWTPLFPKLGDPPPHNGHELAALEMKYRREAETVVVAVSLIYGRPHQANVPVREVRVARGERVRVDELIPFGIAPVTLSIVRRATGAIAVPQVVSASTAIAFDVRTPSDAEAQYKVRLRNLSGRSLLLLYFEAEAGGKGPMVGYKRGTRGAPLVDAGGETTFELPVTGSAPAFADGTWAPRAIVSISVKTVVWSDGTVEGDRDPLSRDQAAAAGMVVQLRRVIEILDGAVRDGGGASLQGVADAIGRLDVKASPALVAETRARLRPATGPRPLNPETSIPIGMQMIKDAARGDLNDVPASQLTSALMSLREQYAIWMQRMQQLSSF